jgi:hypothetical protein
MAHIRLMHCVDREHINESGRFSGKCLSTSRTVSGQFSNRRLCGAIG